jgi:hypothetical protein
VKNLIRIVAVVLPLAGAVSLATSQSTLAMPRSSLQELAMSQSGIQEIIVTGSENSIRERIGLPPLRDDFTVEGSPEAPSMHRPPVRHRTHDR